MREKSGLLCYSRLERSSTVLTRRGPVNGVGSGLRKPEHACITGRHASKRHLSALMSKAIQVTATQGEQFCWNKAYPTVWL